MLVWAHLATKNIASTHGELIVPTLFDPHKGERIRLEFESDVLLRNVPKLMALYGAAITNWSWIEQHYQNVRSVLHFDGANPSFEGFKEPLSTPRQIELLKKTAAKQLDRSRWLLFNVALTELQKPAEVRNALAHGIVGYCDVRPNCLILFRQADLQKLYRTTFAPPVKTGKLLATDDEIKRAANEMAKKGLMFDVDDLQNVIAAGKQSNTIALPLASLCSDAPAVAAIGRGQLLAIPEIKQAFDQVLAIECNTA